MQKLYFSIALLLGITPAVAGENSLCHQGDSSSVTCITTAWDTYYEWVKEYTDTLQAEAKEKGKPFDQGKTISEFEQKWPFAFFQRSFNRCGEYTTDIEMSKKCLMESIPDKKIKQVLTTKKK